MKHRNTPITGDFFIDGKRIDLLRLFQAVLTHGGSLSTTQKNQWPTVAQAVGFQINPSDPQRSMQTVNHVKTQYTNVLNPFEELWLNAITKVPHPGSSSAVGGNLWLLHNKQVQVQGQHPPPPLQPVLPKANEPPPTQQQHLVLTASSILALPIELLDLIFDYLLAQEDRNSTCDLWQNQFRKYG
ncbi:hypothetical protein BT69DRAFT_123522 [Atractiella rhizophila]|nr:hypothetical protein BT69DRAFT_123522 [Atractiella rhizophila]